MGCSASKPGLVNEFRDVKLEQIQNAKLTPPTVGHVVAQPRPEQQQKPAQEAQPGFFDANLTFANVVWNNATKAPQPALKPALRASGTSGAAPTLVAPKKPPAKPAAPVPAPKPAATTWPVENDNWDGDDWDEDYDEDEDDDARMADPDMFRTRVNHANFEWEGNGEHIDVLPKKDDKQMVNPFVGVPLPLTRQSLAKQPAASVYHRPSPLEKAAEAIAKENKGKDSKGPSLHASPFEAKPPAAKAAAAPMASPFAAGAAPPMASPFASAAAGAKPLQPALTPQQAAAMQSLLMNVPPEQQANVRAAMMKNQALAHQRAQAAYAAQPGVGAMYPSAQHQAQAQQVPNGYTNEMLMQQLQQQQMQQTRAIQAQQQMQAQQMQAQQMQQRQAQAGGWP
jgi:hypothetical protein